MTPGASEIDAVAVIGSGIMGEGIAQSFAEAGLKARLIDIDQTALDRSVAQISANLEMSAAFGLLNEAPPAIAARLEPVLSDDAGHAADGCDFVVEAAPEDLALKRDLFARLDTLPAHVILASNTSSLTVSAIAAGMERPERVVGVHYFNPAHIIPAVEIHRGEATGDDVVAATRALLARTGKIPVLVKKEVPGFIINRLTGALEREVDYLLDEGIVAPEDLDAAVKASLGFRLACLGPMEAEDFIGLDTAARASGNLFKVLSNAQEPSPGLLQKLERGELGIKSGKGWYDYTGRSREAVLAERDARLLRQLALFRAERAS
ncbi:MAG: 3-hydroxyacyl-CoA dehydrogenase NAD-binding domain-containing protein [Sphingomonadales bacterium]|nr:3-hydroxyacyl-CoA dehydrogenase NAD-binding domain-containing protein [Sphingomonadales bacterium]